jgi:DNA-binding MarR family transcriptional regulator
VTKPIEARGVEPESYALDLDQSPAAKEARRLKATRYISEHGEAVTADIAGHLRITHHQAASLLRSMRDKGLLRKRHLRVKIRGINGMKWQKINVWRLA